MSQSHQSIAGTYFLSLSQAATEPQPSDLRLSRPHADQHRKTRGDAQNVTRRQTGEGLKIAATTIHFQSERHLSHTRQPEHVDRVAQHLGLLLHRLGSSRRLFDHRGILLGRFVHLSNGDIHLLDAAALLLGRD